MPLHSLEIDSNKWRTMNCPVVCLFFTVYFDDLANSNDSSMWFIGSDYFSKFGFTSWRSVLLGLLFLKVGHGLFQLMIVLAVGVTINVYFLMHFISVLYFMFLKIVSKGIKENSITGLNSNAFLYLFMVSLSYAHVSFIFLQCISLRFCGIECLSHAPSRKNLK